MSESASAKVAPFVELHNVSIEVVVPPYSVVDGYSGERNPLDEYLPITESRNGSTISAVGHLLCSGVGIQTLLLPAALVSLGWFWGLFCLSLAFLWQLYTKWLLVHLHESSPPTRIRYSRYVHLSIVAFGPKLGKWLAIFPTMYLSGGSCVMYIISGGTALRRFYQVMGGSNADKITGSEWFLLFIFMAIFMALFFHNLDSLTYISIVGSISALAYCSLLWALPLSLGNGRSKPDVNESTSHGFHQVLNGISIVILAFRGNNLVLEIQGTLPTNPKQPSQQSMLKGLTISYTLISLCFYPLTIVGYWVYGNSLPTNGGITGPFINAHQKGTIYFLMIINFLCAFQIYAMPTFDNLERIYVRSKNKVCPKRLCFAIKVLFGGLTYLIAMAFPFLPSLSYLIGAIALPVTLVYPCLMWVVIKKSRCFSAMWCVNVGVGCVGVGVCVMCGCAALWTLVVSGLQANLIVHF